MLKGKVASYAAGLASIQHYPAYQAAAAYLDVCPGRLGGGGVGIQHQGYVGRLETKVLDEHATYGHGVVDAASERGLGAWVIAATDQGPLGHAAEPVLAKLG